MARALTRPLTESEKDYKNSITETLSIVGDIGGTLCLPLKLLLQHKCTDRKITIPDFAAAPNTTATPIADS